jgi:hypothetical protein
MLARVAGVWEAAKSDRHHGPRMFVRPLSPGSGRLRKRSSHAPDATVRVYPETGHAVHWDRPEQVVKHLMEETRTVP